MNTRFRRTRLASAVAGAVLVLGAGQAWGAAFALQENSGSGLGNAYAGGAAVAEDAATVWSNPAGMALIGSNQVVAAVNLINPSSKLNNDGGSLAAFNQALGGTGGDAGSLAAVPNLYLVLPINKSFAFGIGVNAPFGLVTEYDDGWLGRYQALKSDLKTINVNPAISWRMTDNFSVGVGASYQQIKATFTNNVNYSGALATAAQTAAAGGLIPAALVPTIIGATGSLDAKANVSGDDYSWGWNIGALWEINKGTRVGAAYRSSIKYDINGNVDFSYPALPTLPPALAPVVGLLASNVNNVLASGGVTSSIELPPIANVSFFSRLNDKWDIMADAQWTGWSTISELKFVRTTGATLNNTPENFKDVWRISAGANYHMDDKWMFRGGVAWDQSPVNSTDMTPRLPDNDRTWLALGVQYKASPALKLDAGFSYIWVKDPEINQNAGSTTANGLISGNYNSNVTILSLQGTYSF
jgi:long-chain fatty acid transport protein